MSTSLIFIADISGFTRFVNDTEINHSRHIISELLEILIDSNRLDMEVAEIEGDAILFYRYRHVPDTSGLIAQAKEMFIRFHSHLTAYSQRRICHCGACSSAHNLTLKFIVHQGNFNFLRVKQHRKPHGADVVLAHRLLKNDIPGKEYVLFTSGFLKHLNKQELISGQAVEVESGHIIYDEIGDINYQYIHFGSLKKEVQSEPSTYPDLTPDPIIIEREIALEVQALFELITNFDFREQWSDDALRLEYLPDRVNRVGTRHVCVFENENLEFETVTNDFGPNKLVYGERLDNYKFVREAINYFILEDKGKSTILRIESHIKPKNAIVKLFSPFYKMIFRKNLNKAINNIEKAAKRFRKNVSRSKPLSKEVGAAI